MAPMDGRKTQGLPEIDREGEGLNFLPLFLAQTVKDV